MYPYINGEMMSSILATWFYCF